MKIKKQVKLAIGVIILLLLVSGCSIETKYQCADNTFVSNSADCLKIEPVIKEIEKIVEVPVKEIQVTAPVVKEKIDTATIGEKNALSKALTYLDYLAFSREGLITQLEFEGYSNAEAKYGVDNCKANWNEQAALKAQSYLDYSAFSREGLIEQLEFEGFTREQAEYGVKAVGY